MTEADLAKTQTKALALLTTFGNYQDHLRLEPINERYDSDLAPRLQTFVNAHATPSPTPTQSPSQSPLSSTSYAPSLDPTNDATIPSEDTVCAKTAIGIVAIAATGIVTHKNRRNNKKLR